MSHREHPRKLKGTIMAMRATITTTTTTMNISTGRF